MHLVIASLRIMVTLYESTVQWLVNEWSLYGLIHRLENHAVLQNKQHHMKVLLSGFSVNGQTAWFDLQTKNVEPHCTYHKTNSTT